MPLTISVPGCELFNNETGKFTDLPPTTLVLEHSLISISKWESKFHKSFIDTKEKTLEETAYYIKCMSLKGEISDSVVNNLTLDNFNEIRDYINDPMTASTVKREETKKSNQIITSELIYSWMVGFQIPVEFEKWHINRLLILIEILEEQNKPKDKRTKKSSAEIARKYAEINARNREKFNSKG